jgi:hypothetical protein
MLGPSVALLRLVTRVESQMKNSSGESVGGVLVSYNKLDERSLELCIDQSATERQGQCWNVAPKAIIRWLDPFHHSLQSSQR